MRTKNKEIKGIFLIVVLLFAMFLIYPVVRLLLKSFVGNDGITLEFYRSVLSGKGFLKALGNSFKVAEKGHQSGCGTSDAATDIDLWICTDLFLWKTGTSDKIIWTPVI